jgi:isocitrate lyase
LSDAIANAAASGGGDASTIEKEWTAKARPMTFGEAVLDKIDSLPVDEGKKRDMVKAWEASDPDSLSNAAAHRVANSIFGKKNSIYLDWEACRVREGYYRIKPGIQYCIRRGRAYAPHADLIWMETVSTSSILISLFF